MWIIKESATSLHEEKKPSMCIVALEWPQRIGDGSFAGFAILRCGIPGVGSLCLWKVVEGGAIGIEHVHHLCSLVQTSQLIVLRPLKLHLLLDPKTPNKTKTHPLKTGSHTHMPS